MGTLADLIHLLYDADPDRMHDARITPYETFRDLNAAQQTGDAAAALALLDAEIARLQPIQRLLLSDAARSVRLDPERGLDLPLYLSDLHCRRARLHVAGGNTAGARADLLAAQVLTHPHPDAAPLLVEAYEQAGAFGYAMSLLSRIHRDHPESLAIGLLRLVIHARHTGADMATVESGIDLLARADRYGLYAGLVKEHRSWHGPPPHDDALADIHRAAVSALDARNHPTAKAFIERLLAWAPEYAPGWLMLGRCFEAESGQQPPIEPTDRLMVMGIPNDLTTLHAAADAFELAAHFDPGQVLLWTALAGARLALGDLRAALAAADCAVAVDPQDTESHWLMAVAQQGLGRAEEAMKSMARIVELDPTSEHAARVFEIINAALADGAKDDD